MENKNSLKKNIMCAFSANFIATLVGFASSFIFPKILSIDAYAIYHAYTLYLGYIAILHLGFPSGMVIKYAGKRYSNINKKQYKSEVMLLLFILFLFTFIFLLYSIAKSNIMLVFISFSIIPVCWIGSYKALVQAWDDFKSYTRINIGVSVAVPILAILYYIIKRDLPGNIYISIYLFVYAITTVYLLALTAKDLSGIRPAKIFSKTNFEIEKTGAIVAIGSYVNTLFASADKQFVIWFFTNIEFAYYSFAMSMQSIMSVLITSIAQPLFPAMAQGKFVDEEYDDIKNILCIFGSFSGCAYFAVSIIVKLFIPKYTESLGVTALYFSVFPAMAIIQCLYINLYKIKGIIKTYVLTLLSVLGIAVGLNLFMVKTFGQFTGIAIATVATYYIWVVIGIYQFKFIRLKLKEIIFLIMYFITYFSCTTYLNDLIGFLVYTIIMILIVTIFYKDLILKYTTSIFKNSKGV